jgi:hypothetical protein
MDEELSSSLLYRICQASDLDMHSWTCNMILPSAVNVVNLVVLGQRGGIVQLVYSHYVIIIEMNI